MIMDYIDIDPVPTGEECAQVGEPDYGSRARREANAYANQLRRQSPPPPGARVKVARNEHDFGHYLSIWLVYDESDEETVRWAYELEADLPERWDEEAMRELQEGDCDE